MPRHVIYIMYIMQYQDETRKEKTRWDERNETNMKSFRWEYNTYRMYNFRYEIERLDEHIPIYLTMNLISSHLVWNFSFLSFSETCGSF